MVQHTQSEQPEQQFVTDGTHVYHYNEHLAELVTLGSLKFCPRPLLPPTAKRQAAVVPDEPVMDDVQEQLVGGLADAEPLPEPEPVPETKAESKLKLKEQAKHGKSTSPD